MNWDIVRFYVVWNLVTVPMAFLVVFPVVLIATLNPFIWWGQAVLRWALGVIVSVSDWRNELRIIRYLRNRKDLFEMLSK